MTVPGLPDFDRRADRYDNHASLQREVASWLAEWLPDQVPAPALEMGAGTGIFTRHIAARTPQLVACDVAPRMIDIGRRQLPGILWSLADATHPPGESGYHSVFSCSLIQWLPDPALTFRTWHQRTVPGARLLSGWFIQGTLADFYAICPDVSPVVWRTAHEWLEMLGQAGWKVVRSEERSFPRIHQRAVDMLRAVHDVGAVVPGRLTVAGLRQALRRYDARHRSVDSVRSDFVFLRVEAARS